MKTIVSVTPLAVEADSRTFKEAASFSRLGYRSIVVEGRPSSQIAAELPFELRSLPGTGPTADGAMIAGEAVQQQPEIRATDRLPAVVRRVARAPYGAIRWLLRRARDVLRVGPNLPTAAVYVLHEFSLFGAVYVAARRNGAAVVYDAHDLYSALAEEQRDQPGFSYSVVLLGNLLERLCVRTAAARMTVAPGLAELQRRRFSQPFAVVRNAHDPRLDQPPPVSIRELTGAPDQTMLIAVVGNAKPSMAISEMLEAQVLLPDDIRIAFVGRGYEHHAQVAERMGLAERVSFPGAVPPPQITAFLRSADLAASIYVPSSTNAFNALPNGFLQSLAAGLPILYPHLPEIEAIARQYRLGVPIDPRDPVDLAAQILALRSDPGAMNRFRSGARRAAAELTWEREEQALGHLISPLVAEHDARRRESRQR